MSASVWFWPRNPDSLVLRLPRGRHVLDASPSRLIFPSPDVRWTPERPKPCVPTEDRRDERGMQLPEPPNGGVWAVAQSLP